MSWSSPLECIEWTRHVNVSSNIGSSHDLGSSNTLFSKDWELQHRHNYGGIVDSTGKTEHREVLSKNLVVLLKGNFWHRWRLPGFRLMVERLSSCLQMMSEQICLRDIERSTHQIQGDLDVELPGQGLLIHAPIIHILLSYPRWVGIDPRSSPSHLNSL